MYCPRCGQQQASDSVRFCSRCGFRMDFVTDLLYNDGLLQIGEPLKQDARGPRKRRGMRQGAKIMFFSAVMTPIFFGLSIAADNPGPLLVPFTLFLAGLAWMFYFRLFGEDFSPAAVQAKPQQYIAPPPRASLLPTQDPPVIASPRRVNTADMANPPTVTDPTTRLFDEK